MWSPTTESKALQIEQGAIWKRNGNGIAYNITVFASCFSTGSYVDQYKNKTDETLSDHWKMFKSEHKNARLKWIIC